MLNPLLRVHLESTSNILIPKLRNDLFEVSSSFGGQFAPSALQAAAHVRIVEVVQGLEGTSAAPKPVEEPVVFGHRKIAVDHGEHPCFVLWERAFDLRQQVDVVCEL